jgi:hypothetical protein
VEAAVCAATGKAMTKAMQVATPVISIRVEFLLDISSPVGRPESKTSGEPSIRNAQGQDVVSGSAGAAARPTSHSEGRLSIPIRGVRTGLKWLPDET